MPVLTCVWARVWEQVPERERRIADFKQLFGDPTFKEHKLTVPAGRYGVVLRALRVWAALIVLLITF